MLFNSLDFAVFLVIVFALYWFVFNRNLRVQNAFIVVASYVFYGWWDWRFLVLIAITTLCSYLSGLMALRIKNQPTSERERPSWYRNPLWWITAGNISVNLLILFYFKYYNFFVTSFVDAFTLFGKHLNISTLKIILPVGISFYTFQALSYSIDIYRRNVKPTKDIVAFFAFLSFFPQLVAGPIERATTLLPQFLQKRRFDYPKAADGMRQILWGLFKKIVIADNCGICVNYINSNTDFLPGSTLYVGLVLAVFQCYCDFSGYSDIAIGTGRLFGIGLSRNFIFPIFANSFSDYWRRNHISMTQWFMDYVYYPMIGKSDRLWQWNLCMVLTFLLSGLWHGADWSFVLWGFFHGVLICISNNTQKFQKKFEKKHRLKGVLWYHLLRIGGVFFVITMLAPFFAQPSIQKAVDYLGKVFTPSLFKWPYGSTYAGKYVMVLLLIFVLAEWFQQDKQHALQLDGVRSKALRWAIYIAVIALIFNYGGVSAPFVYFQF